MAFFGARWTKDTALEARENKDCCSVLGGVVEDMGLTWVMPANQALKYLGFSVFEYIILVRWPSY